MDSNTANNIANSDEFIVLSRKGDEWTFVHSALTDLNEAIDMMKQCTTKMMLKRDKILRDNDKSNLN